MSALPARERCEASDSLVPLQLDDGDITRAIFIYRRACDEAARRHEECAERVGSTRNAWRELVAREALHRRMKARVRARIARQWLTTQALRDWLPHGRGH